VPRFAEFLRVAIRQGGRLWSVWRGTIVARTTEAENRVVPMAHYMFIARYASGGVKGVVAAGGSARRAAIQKMAEGLGKSAVCAAIGAAAGGMLMSTGPARDVLSASNKPRIGMIAAGPCRWHDPEF